MSKKRILLVSPFPPSIGGVSISVQRLYDVLISKGYKTLKFNTHFVNRKLNASKPLKFIKYLLLPGYLMVSRRFDVIHFHISGVFPRFYISMWRSFFSGKTKFITTVHGQVSHVLSSPLGRSSLEKFDKIICVKKGDTLSMPASLRAKTVEIPAFIPPVISDESYNTDISDNLIPELLREFLKRNSIRLLINGFVICNDKFQDLYGIKDAIVLLEHLRERGRKADLIIIIIDPPDNDESRKYLVSLKEYTINKNLADHILWVENTIMELWPVLKRVHIFLRPTKTDGDALSVRESLWLKKPAITSGVVPRPEGTVIYNRSSENDFLEKTLSVIDNYNYYVAGIGMKSINFAQKIIEQYES